MLLYWKEWPAHPVRAATRELQVLKTRFCVCFAAAKVNHKSITEKTYFASIEKNKKYNFTMMEEGYYQIPAYGNHEENIKEDKS